MKQLYHPTKLSTLPLKAVTSWKKNTLHSKSFSSKVNLNKRPYNPFDYQKKPKTGPENYQWLQHLWTENQWSTFADFLKWYNNLDVTPMIKAIENMNEFYKNIRIDFIHQAISIPGVAMRVCFNSITDPAADSIFLIPRIKIFIICLKRTLLVGLV